MTGRDDSPVLGTRVPRKERDRFAACAAIFATSEGDLLRKIVFIFNDLVLSTDSHVEELYTKKRRLESEAGQIESEVDHYIKNIFIEQAKKWSRPRVPGPTATEREIAEKIVKVADESGIPAAVEGLRAVEPQAVRIKVESLLSRERPELWKEVRPLISSRRSPEAKA